MSTIFFYFQTSFSSVSSFDLLPSQHHQFAYESSAFAAASGNFNFIPEPSSQQQQFYCATANQSTSHQPIHSNSSSETLVGLAESSSRFGSTDSIAPPFTSQFKEEIYHHTHEQTASTPNSELDYFERSSTDDIGLLTLRSSSDPTIALNSYYSTREKETNQDISERSNDNKLRNELTPSTSVLNSSLPSFQETYSIKYNQLSSLGLTMDEDCYNVASPHHPGVSNYHIGHGHHSTTATYPQEHYEYQQSSPSNQFTSPGNPGYYSSAFEQHGNVSLFLFVRFIFIVYILHLV